MPKLIVKASDYLKKPPPTQEELIAFLIEEQKLTQQELKNTQEAVKTSPRILYWKRSLLRRIEEELWKIQQERGEDSTHGIKAKVIKP